MQPHVPDIMALIAQAPWREAVTYRDSWPHEYVVIKKDAQHNLLAAFCERIARGGGRRVLVLRLETAIPLPGRAQVLDDDGMPPTSTWTPTTTC